MMPSYYNSSKLLTSASFRHVPGVRSNRAADFRGPPIWAGIFFVKP